MQVAVAALKDEGATVGQLADRLGYRSEAAFKRVISVSPGAMKRTAREQDRALIVRWLRGQSDLT
jgi:AraC-like DNA-binding protein